MGTTLRASDRAYRQLREEIVDWAIPPGTVLGEVELAERLGVSRTPIREALARLVADGLVATQDLRGLVVTSLSTDNIRELFEVRQALEQQAARLAAERGDPKVFSSLEQEFLAVLAVPAFLGGPEVLTTDDDARHSYYDTISRFDDALDDATDNAYLVAALANVRTHLARVRRLAKDNPKRLAAAAVEHSLIAQAISARNPELAAHATHVHLHRAMQSAVASVNGSPRDGSPHTETDHAPRTETDYAPRTKTRRAPRTEKHQGA